MQSITLGYIYCVRIFSQTSVGHCCWSLSMFHTFWSIFPSKGTAPRGPLTPPPESVPLGRMPIPWLILSTGLPLCETCWAERHHWCSVKYHPSVCVGGGGRDGNVIVILTLSWEMPKPDPSTRTNANKLQLLEVRPHTSVVEEGNQAVPL